LQTVSIFDRNTLTRFEQPSLSFLSSKLLAAWASGLTCQAFFSNANAPAPALHLQIIFKCEITSDATHRTPHSTSG